MRIISKKTTPKYTELTIERSLLFFKYKTTYRETAGGIYRFVAPDKYFNIGTLEYLDIRDYFKIEL